MKSPSDAPPSSDGLFDDDDGDCESLPAFEADAHELAAQALELLAAAREAKDEQSAATAREDALSYLHAAGEVGLEEAWFPRWCLSLMPPDALRSLAHVVRHRGDFTHARGFPGLGPPTLCGEGEPPTGPLAVSVITCPKCLDLLEDVNKLAARAEQLAKAAGRTVLSVVGGLDELGRATPLAVEEGGADR